MSVDEIMIPLFVPGHRTDRVVKAATSGADSVIVDLEDAVAIEDKERARESLSVIDIAVPIIVRINAIGTFWHDADVASTLDATPTAVMIPKAEISEQFYWLCQRFDAANVPIIALVETARGLVGARQLATMSNVRRIAFGSVDFCADVGCSDDRSALLIARSELVLASRLGDMCAPIDGVTTAIENAALIADDARHARILGFGGKLCIHPKQIPFIAAGFRPDEVEVAWALRVLDGGDGATAVDGAMVDAPVRARARRILASHGH